MNLGVRYASLLALLLAGCGDDSDDKALWNERTGQSSEAMKLDFLLTDPASIPLAVNPFGPGMPAGTGVPDDPNCIQCSMTLHNVTVRNDQIATQGTIAQYAASLWSHGGTGSLSSTFSASIPTARAAFDAGYASNLSSTIGTFETLLKQWPNVDPNTIVTQKPAPQEWFRAFKPIQTRSRNSTSFASKHPLSLEELRHRGARSYCAMRETARQQDLARQAGTPRYLQTQSTSSTFLEWKIGKAESTVAIGSPTKNVNSKVANVFVIPMAVGSNIAPIHGPLVPSPGQIVHPISWISGDSIVFSVEGSQTFINSQHADAFIGQRVSGSIVASNLPLFRYGFINVTAAFTFSAEYGTLLSPDGTASGLQSELTAGRGLWIPLPTPTHRTHLLDKLVNGHYRPTEIGSDSAFSADGTIGFIREDDGFAPGYAFVLWPGYWTRVRTTDDRAVTVGDRIQERLAVNYAGSFGASFGLLTIDISVGGSSTLDLNVRQLTTLREQVSAVDSTKLLPFGDTMPSGANVLGQSNLIVVPETKKDYTIEPLTVIGSVRVHGTIGPFGVDKSFSQQILKLPSIDLGSKDQQIGNEASRLRVGSFTDLGLEYDDTDPEENYRSAYSHLPHPTLAENAIPSFASFPSDGNNYVGKCIADTSTPPGNPPAPTPAAPGTPPQLKLCVYGPTCPTVLDAGGPPRGTQCPNLWNIPSNICAPGGVTNYLNARGYPPGATRTCFNSVLTFLCDPTVSPAARVQTWAGLGNVIARPVRDNNDVDQRRIIEIQTQCLQGMGATVTSLTQAEQLADLVQSLLHYGVCDASNVIQGEQGV
jgi:hypothetical protein